MRFVLVNGRTPRSRSFLCLVLRAGRRQLPARAGHALLLLQITTATSVTAGCPTRCSKDMYRPLIRECHETEPQISGL
jgi:hypothetical protein